MNKSLKTPLTQRNNKKKYLSTINVDNSFKKLNTTRGKQKIKNSTQLTNKKE